MALTAQENSNVSPEDAPRGIHKRARYFDPRQMAAEVPHLRIQTAEKQNIFMIAATRHNQNRSSKLVGLHILKLITFGPDSATNSAGQTTRSNQGGQIGFGSVTPTIESLSGEGISGAQMEQAPEGPYRWKENPNAKGGQDSEVGSQQGQANGSLGPTQSYTVDRRAWTLKLHVEPNYESRTRGYHSKNHVPTFSGSTKCYENNDDVYCWHATQDTNGSTVYFNARKTEEKAMNQSYKRGRQQSPSGDTPTGVTNQTGPQQYRNPQNQDPNPTP
jgi:hypothetical protein